MPFCHIHKYYLLLALCYNKKNPITVICSNTSNKQTNKQQWWDDSRASVPWWDITNTLAMCLTITREFIVPSQEGVTAGVRPCRARLAAGQACVTARGVLVLVTPHTRKCVTPRSRKCLSRDSLTRISEHYALPNTTLFFQGHHPLFCKMFNT